jgi:hypothetical protein
MLYHKSCMSNVHVDVTAGIKILSCYGLSSKGSTTGMLELTVVKKTIPLQFYCQECDSQVENTDIVILCGICGKQIPLTDAFTNPESGGLYCKEDAEEKFGADFIIPVKTSLDTIKIKG